MSVNQYPNLSKDELYLISRAEFERQKLITSAFANRLFDNPKRTVDVLDTLARKGRLLQIQRGKYLLVPIKAPNQQWAPNEFMVVALWMGDTPYSRVANKVLKMFIFQPKNVADSICQ